MSLGRRLNMFCRESGKSDGKDGDAWCLTASGAAVLDEHFARHVQLQA
jgi:hypothetical protein